MFLGLQARNVNLEDESTLLIDTEKYFKIFNKLSKTNECSENEVYQDCGKKCILSCRFASSALGISLSTDECEQTACVKGCFCKEGLVRHGDKCVAIAECSTRTDRSNKVVETQPEQQFIIPFNQAFGQQFEQQQQQFLPFQPFGIFKHIFRPGCGIGGCAPQTPANIHIHNHNEAVNGE